MAFVALFDRAGLTVGVVEETDDGFRYIEASEATAERYGLTAQELAGRTAASLGLTVAMQTDIRRQIALCHVEGPQRTEVTGQAARGARVIVTMLAPAPSPTERLRAVYLTLDITEQRQAEQQALRQGELMLVALDAAALGVWEYDLVADRLTIGPGSGAIMGWEADTATREAFMNRVHPADTAQVYAAQEAASRGENEGRYRVEHRVLLESGEVRWVETSGRMIFAADGTAQRAVGAVRDISAEVEARERQAFLMLELNHRVKNNLAVVGAIARYTLQFSQDQAQFRRDFEARIDSLAAAHDLLAEGQWGETELGELLQSAVGAALRPVALEGPRGLVLIGAERALSLAVVVNELCTNAVKHGAHSNAEGEVTLSWQIAGDTVAIEWVERGGPPVKLGPRRGFGATLLRRGAGDPSDPIRTDFDPAGLRVTMVLHRSRSVRF